MVVLKELIEHYKKNSSIILLTYYFQDLPHFKSELMRYLIFYNTKRVHRGLNNLSPIDFVLKCYPEYQMYVTHTGIKLLNKNIKLFSVFVAIVI